MTHKYVDEAHEFHGTKGDERCLLLVDGDRDRELLAEQLGDGREVLTTTPGGTIPRFDLCIADVASYRRVMDGLAARKRASASYQPVLLLVSEGGGPGNSEWIAEQLRGTADDVLVIPATRHELDARVASLLRARRQSRTLEYFRRAMDEASIGITITDPNEPENPLVYVNDGFCRLTGYDRDAILGRNLRFLQGPETERTAVRELHDTLAGGDPVTVELTNYRADGEPFRNRVTVNPIRGDDGEVSHHLAFQQDVTERHELTDRLRTETNLLERVFETSPAGITVIDADGDIVRANDTAEEELGLERSEIVSRTYDDPAWDIFDENGQPIPSEELPAARVLATGAPVEGFTHGFRVDGERRSVSVNAAPLVDEDGDVDGVVASIEDITDRRERQRELEQYESVIESVNDGVWVFDEDKKLTYINTVIQDQFDPDPAEIVGTPLSDFEDLFVDSATFEEYESILDGLLAGDIEEGQLEVSLNAPSSKMVMEIDFSRLPGDDPSARIVGIGRDITDRVERNRELEAQFRQQQAVTDLGRMALETSDLDAVLERASDLVSTTLDMEFCKVLQLEADGDELQLRAGVGWDDGYVGEATIPTETGSQGGYTLLHNTPIVVEDHETESRFESPTLLTDHGVTSGISVLIGHPDDPWGVLGTDSRESRTFSEHDTQFVQSIANILATAIERADRERELEQFETIVQTTADPIWVLDDDGRFVRVNDAMVELSGYSREELLGQHASTVLDEASLERGETEIRELLESGRDRGSFEGTMHIKDGSRRRYVTSVAILREDDEFVGTVLAGHDVTDLREQQRRVSVLDRVLRHNLRNRMGVIMGYATDLAAHSDPDVARLGATIEESATGLLALGETARKFESVVSDGSVQATTVDIVEQVETVVEEARFDHPSVDLAVDVPPSASARAHPGFEIALEEVLENAISHSDRETPTVRVEVTAGPDDVEVRVVDDGPGIEEIDRCALMRGSETPLEHSQGLGLWLVRWTVESVGGTIYIGDNDPRGTVVTLTLPRS